MTRRTSDPHDLPDDPGDRPLGTSGGSLAPGRGAAACEPGRLDIGRPFSKADGVAAGIPYKVLRGSRFRRLFRDVYISSDVREHLDDRTRGALLLHPESAYASHQTAAELYGVAVPPSSLVHLSVFRARDRRWCEGIQPHVAPPGTVVRSLRGIRISDKYRMFIELAGVLELVDLVVVGDNMLRVFGIQAADLRAALSGSSDYWSGAARHAAGYVRDRVDSPMETRLRMLLVLAGLPEPEVNRSIRDDRGNVVLRFDLSYGEARVAVEFEGRQHVELVRQWEKDIVRDDTAALQDWRIVKITSHGIFVDPGQTVSRVWQALRSRGMLVAPPTDGWRKHFPGRRVAS